MSAFNGFRYPKFQSKNSCRAGEKSARPKKRQFAPVTEENVEKMPYLSAIQLCPPILFFCTPGPFAPPSKIVFEIFVNISPPSAAYGPNP